jgi:hypothetical protein
MEKNEIRELAKLLTEELHSLHSADYAQKWEGGSLFFIPQHSDKKDYEMPIDKFMHKIVMMRDNLRVLEQQINANDNLTEGEKLKFQSYITRCYGSLTSFNFLFRYEEDKFKSK